MERRLKFVLLLCAGLAGLHSAVARDAVYDDFERAATSASTNMALAIGPGWVNGGIYTNSAYLLNGRVETDGKLLAVHSGLETDCEGSGTNFTLSCVVRMDITEAPAWAGIIFNYQDEENFYVFRHNGVGKVQIVRFADGAAATVSGGLLNQDEAFFHEQNRPYRMVIKCEEPYSYSVRIEDAADGEKLLFSASCTDSSDARFAGGLAGIMDAAAGLASFDNFHLDVVRGDGVESAELRMIGSTPRFYVNGEPEVPVAYKTLGEIKGEEYWQGCLETVAMVRDAGVHMYATIIHMHVLGLPTRLFRGLQPRFDDSDFDEIIAVDPDARFLVNLGMIPDDFYRYHNQVSFENPYPDTTDTNRDGMLQEYNIKTGTIDYRDRPDPSCDKLWDDMEMSLSAIIEHLEEKYGDRIVMYWPYFGDLGEWYYWCWYPTVPGFGTSTKEKFRSWASNTYSTVSSVNAAWGTSYDDFADIDVPTWTQRKTSSNGGYFFDPVADRYVIDFLDFFNSTMNIGAKRIAAHIKAACDRKRLVGMCWQYYAPLANGARTGAGLNHSGHIKVIDLLESDDIDVLLNPYYPFVNHWTLPFHGTPDTIQNRGKLYWLANDMMTHLSLNSERSTNLTQTLNVYTRDFEEYVDRECGVWLFDIAANGETNSILKEPAIWDVVGERCDYWREHCFEPEGSGFAPEIAVLRNEKTSRYMVSQQPVLSAAASGNKYDPNAQTTQHLVELRDAPMGWYLTEDLIDGLIPDSVKMFVFTDPYVLDGTDAQAVLDRLHDRPGCMAVWLYAPGYVDPETDSMSVDYVERLTGGIRPALLDSPLPDVLQAAPHFLTTGVPNFGTEISTLKTQFYIPSDQSGVEPLFVYASNTTKIAAAFLPADAERPWDSVYVCSPVLSPEFLEHLADRAGLLPADNFNDESLVDWTQDAGSWQVSTGMLFRAQVGEGGYITLNEFTSADFSIQADVRVVGAGWGAVQFRKHTPDANPFSNGYMVYLRQTGRAVLYRDGMWLASGFVNGNPTNGFVRIRVEVLGDTISLHANEEPVFSVQDSTYTNGYVGIASSQDADVWFDRFRVEEYSSDVDGDRLPNEWELSWFGSPAGADAQDDEDADGFSNWQEYIAGTDPTNALSLLALSGSNATAAGKFVVSWPSVSGRAYRLLSTTNLVSGSWTTNASGLQGDAELSYTNASDAGRFYKVEIE